MYIRKDYIFENSIEREEYHDGIRKAPGQKRGKKRKPTKEEMKRANERQKRKRAARIIKKNFHSGDYWTTFTYRKSDRPEGMEEAKKDFQKLMRTIKRKYKAKENELKYWGVIEIGERGGVHFHVIINRIDGTDLILQEAWKKGAIHNELVYEDSDGGFRNLVDYMLKSSDQEGKEPGKAQKWESRSRNLEEPEVKKKIISSATYRKGANVPKGYYLEKGSMREGVNEYTGYKYRSYTLIKKQEGKRSWNREKTG